MPQNGTAGSGELALWDGVGLGDAPRLWADSIGVSVREQSLDSLGVTAATNGTGAASGGWDDTGGGSGRFAPAVALGLLALDRTPVAPDLLHSRLVERKKSRAAKPLVWGIVVGCAVILGIVSAVVDLSRQRREVENIKAQLSQMQPDLKTADATITRVSFAQRWQQQDPKFLSVLRDLTAVFPDDTKIWATRLTLQDDGRGTLEGQASGDDVATASQVADAALRRLQEAGHFKEVKVLTVGEAGKNSREVSFGVTFRFTGALPPVPGGAATTSPSTRNAATTNPSTTNPAATNPTTGISPPNDRVNTGDRPALNRGRRRDRR